MIGKTIIPLETQFMCDLVSPGFDAGQYPFASILTKLDPSILFDTLKRHHLYPLFHKVWHSLNLSLTPPWNSFSADLKTLVNTNRVQMITKTTVLLKIAKTFGDKHIPMIALKGPALAQQLYGDVALKASLDLDVFIDVADYKLAVKTLVGIGFENAEVPGNLNQRQETYLINNFHHIGFVHGATKVRLELHWALHTNKYTVGYTFEELYQQSGTVLLAGVAVNVPGELHQCIYLMFHGSTHQWKRLDWLCDWTMISQQCSNTCQGLPSEVRRQGLEKIVAQSVELGQLFFGDLPALREVYGVVTLQPCFLAASARNAILQEYQYSLGILPRLAMKVYLSSLKSDIRYKLKVWKTFGPNLGDWGLLSLPEYLFFLYFPLRPFLYLYKKFVKR
jgi:hypothetical protein